MWNEGRVGLSRETGRINEEMKETSEGEGSIQVWEERIKGKTEVLYGWKEEKDSK